LKAKVVRGGHCGLPLPLSDAEIEHEIVGTLAEVRHEVVEKVAKSFRISSCFREVYTTF